MEGMHYFICLSFQHLRKKNKKKGNETGNDWAGNCHPLGGSR